MTQYPLAMRQSMPTLYGRGQQRGGFPGLQPGPPVPPQQMPPPDQGTQPPLMPGYPGMMDQPRGAPPGMPPQSGMEMDPRMRQMMLAQMLQQQGGSGAEQMGSGLGALAGMMAQKYMGRGTQWRT